jgi:predicted thioesterase
MNAEAVSQIIFATHFEVEPTHTARKVCAPPGADERSRAHLAEVLSTAQLLARAEIEAIQALREQGEIGDAVVLGKALSVQHHAPVAVGAVVDLTGFVGRIGERSLHFEIDACVARERVATASICLVVVARSALPGKAAAEGIDCALPAAAIATP